MNDTKNELEIIELTQENIESMIYTIRGHRVMLDADLAKIYGYSTKAFNQQVKNNIEKFPEDFMFKITRSELDNLAKSQFVTARSDGFSNPNDASPNEKTARSKFLTARIWATNGGGRTSLPYAFTEQGIYMLMTVLKGELAIKQSIALIRFFKRIKDFIVESNNLLSVNGIIELTTKVNENSNRLDKIEKKLNVVMDNFIDPNTYKHFLIYNNERVEADIACQSIYKSAKRSIYIIDDYVGIKTLQLLKVCLSDVDIIIFSDNKSKDRLTKQYLDDFIKDKHISISIKPSNAMFHDRYIVIDYGSNNEIIYHYGTSSKDAGSKVTTITKIINEANSYHKLIERLLSNSSCGLFDVLL